MPRRARHRDPSLSCRWAAALVCGGSLWGVTATALAGPVLVAESERGPRSYDECVVLEQRKAEVEALLGRRVFADAEQADVFVRLEVAERGVIITLLDAEKRSLGRRELIADDCQELQEALTLALSLMLDFDVEEVDEMREAAAQQEAQAKDPTTAETAPPNRAEPDPPPPVESSGQAPSFWAGLEGLLGVGLVDGPIGGVAAGVGVNFGGMYAELDGAHWFERDFSRMGGEVSFSLAELGVVFCPTSFELGHTELLPCAELDGGLARFAGGGFQTTSSGAAFAVRTGVQLRVFHPLPPLVVGGRLSLTSPISGYRAVVVGEDGRQQLLSSARVTGVVGLGLGIRFH